MYLVQASKVQDLYISRFRDEPNYLGVGELPVQCLCSCVRNRAVRELKLRGKDCDARSIKNIFLQGVLGSSIRTIGDTEL